MQKQIERAADDFGELQEHYRSVGYFVPRAIRSYTAVARRLMRYDQRTFEAAYRMACDLGPRPASYIGCYMRGDKTHLIEHLAGFESRMQKIDPSFTLALDVKLLGA